MIEVNLKTENAEPTIASLNKVLKGTISECWGQHSLEFDNDIGIGKIRITDFDWGVSIVEHDVTFKKDVKLAFDSSEYNPIEFSYCIKGHYKLKFGSQDKEDRVKLKQFQSVITSSRDNGFKHHFFPQNENLKIFIIKVQRKKFLKKKLNDVEHLNGKLYETFQDNEHLNRFVFMGEFDLEIGEKIDEIHNVTKEGMVKMLEIEGLVYQTLSIHMDLHNKTKNYKKLKTKLLNSELDVIKELALKIMDNLEEEYVMENLALESGLSEAKLQNGFKLLYAKTVIKFIRNARLEQARDLMKTSDMNISEIMYSIGFSSRSYFSRIFREKYAINPNDYLKKVRGLEDED